MDEIFGYLSENAETQDDVPRDRVEEVLSKESLKSQVLGGSLAVVTLYRLLEGKTVLVIGTSKKGIDFQSEHVQPVKTLILCLANENDPGKHLSVLEAISRYLQIDNTFFS